MQQAVQQTDGGGVLGQGAGPLVEGPVAGDAARAAFVGVSDTGDHLGAGVAEGCEPGSLADDHVIAEKRLNDVPDAVVA
jgi:hypothetical protein